MQEIEFYKLIKENISQIQIKLDTVISTTTSNQLSIKEHELRIKQLEECMKKKENNVNQKIQIITDTVIKVVLTACIAYIMAKMGMSA